MPVTNVFATATTSRTASWSGLAAKSRKAQGIGAWLRTIWSLAGQAATTRAARRRLAEMDDRMLADIGLSRTEAWQEADRPFWDVTGLR